MLHELALKIIKKMVQKNKDVQNMIDIYVYGLECILNSAITIFLIGTASLFMHQFPQILIWLAAFVLLRRHFGGYHAPNHFLCITLSSCLGITAMLLCHFPIFSNRLFVITLYAISILYAIFFVPADNAKKCLSDERKSKEKVKSILILFIEFSLCLFLADTYISYIVLSTLDTLFLHLLLLDDTIN